MDVWQLKNSQVTTSKPAHVGQTAMVPKLGNKELPPTKKQAAVGSQYQDTSVEHLLWEVTNRSFGITQRGLSSNVFLDSLNLCKSMSEFLSLCGLRNTGLNSTASGRS